MADYPGRDLSDLCNIQMVAGEGPPGLVKSSNLWLSEDQKKEGDFSLCLGPGGFKEIFYATAAGAITIDAWVYPLPGSGPVFYAVEFGGRTMDLDEPAGAGAWEALQLSFVAEKKIYKLVIANPITVLGDGQKGWCYFDSIG